MTVNHQGIELQTHGEVAIHCQDASECPAITISPRGLSSNSLLSLVAVGVLLLVIIYLFTSMNQDRPRRQAAPSERSSSTPSSPASSIAPAIPPPAPLSAGDENDPVAAVSILPEGFDFGVMKPGSVTRRTVELRNDSTSAIRILGTKRTCSCTTVEMNPGLLQPGASMPLTAIMAADLTPKDKNSVKVVVQYEDLAPTTISIKGVISQAVSSLPRDIRMHPGGYNNPTYRTTGLLTLRSMDGKPFQVTRVAGGNSGLSVGRLLDGSIHLADHSLGHVRLRPGDRA